MYYMTKFDEVMSSSFAKITSANLWNLIHDIINYSTFICPFQSGKCGKDGKNHRNLIARE